MKTNETRYIESYKVIAGKTPHRRETEAGAIALADRYRKRGFHGMVEAVIIDNGEVKFETIKTF